MGLAVLGTGDLKVSKKQPWFLPLMCSQSRGRAEMEIKKIIVQH